MAKIEPPLRCLAAHCTEDRAIGTAYCRSHRHLHKRQQVRPLRDWMPDVAEIVDHSKWKLDERYGHIFGVMVETHDGLYDGSYEAWTVDEDEGEAYSIEVEAGSVRLVTDVVGSDVAKTIRCLANALRHFTDPKEA